MQLENTIQKIVHYAVYVAEPEEIILFGSTSNGSATVFSDIDLLIITENTIDKKEVIAKIKNYAHQLSLKIDVLVYSRVAFEKEIQTPASFVKAIVKEGKILYKKTAN
jgi:uncharacterized protein